MVNTDLVALQRMIKLPASVASAEWQTGQRAAHGGDWWLAAVLEVAADQMPTFLPGPPTQELFETPQGLALESSFAALTSLPGAQRTETGRLRLVTDTHRIEAYARSPLLNGKAIRLAPTRVLVLLWTQ